MFRPLRLKHVWPIALLWLVGAIVAGGCSQRRPVGPAGAAAELPDQEINDFAITESDAGRTLWKLNALHAAEYRSNNKISAQTLRVDFYNANGERSSVLTAREGEINGRSRDMLARVVYGALDPKTGAAGSVFDLLTDPRHNHCIEVRGGVLADEASARLSNYFRGKRGKPPL